MSATLRRVVSVLDVEVEMPKAIKGKYEEKFTDHVRDAANLVSLVRAFSLLSGLLLSLRR